MKTPPKARGFAMPAEWAPHDRCWMAWPSRDDLWGAGLDAACRAYADVAKAIAAFEPVTMVCNPADVAEASLALGQGIEVLSRPIDDSWVRDTGPSFLTDGRGALAGVDWTFNGWGGKYLPHDNDANLAKRLLRHVGAERFRAPLVLEGGAIHVDGEGTVLTTEQCVLNPNRNPDMTREAAEKILCEWLGADKVIWLPRGLVDDETDGHVDEIACFARPGTVLALTTANRDDPNYQILQDNLAVLRGESDARGRVLQVVELPQPGRRNGPDGRRLTTSYVNFYLANGGLVMPQFEVPEDDRAFRILREVFPERRVVPVPANDIVVGGGGIHCITLQQPSPGPAREPAAP